MKQDTQRDGQATETGSLPPVVCPDALQELIEDIKANIHGCAVNLQEDNLSEKERSHYNGCIIASKDILRKASELLAKENTPLIEREAMEVKTDDKLPLEWSPVESEKQ